MVHGSDGDLHTYNYAKGENLGDQNARKRFSALPANRRVEAVVSVFGALAAVVDAGFTIVDWYEGNMIYDFDAKRIWLFDWDLCRASPSFILTMDSNYGTSRLMAPEELVRGSEIDEVTLVFNLGRFAMIYLPDMMDVLADVLAQATHPSRPGGMGPCQSSDLTSTTPSVSAKTHESWSFSFTNTFRGSDLQAY